MGGHIAGAAIDAETTRTANNKVAYHGAVPMCGVMGDTDLFGTFAAMQVSAQALAGLANYPVGKFADIQATVISTLYTTFPSVPTTAGQKYKTVLKNLTGGTRPLFDLAMSQGGSFAPVFSWFGSDGTLSGILNKNVLDTTGVTYSIDGDEAETAALNAAVQKLSAAPDANRLRSDGLRWVPKVNGDFQIPVVSIHTLGDMYVPFSMEQVFQRRTAAMGNSDWLVQRAIRGVGHCDFTIAEQVNAFDAMVKWERDGVKPGGDDVVTAATVAAPSYGCAHTVNTLGPDDDATIAALRAMVVSQAACPSR
jgi:hypothetical protein